MSGLINKAKDLLHKDKSDNTHSNTHDSSTHTGAHSDTHGSDTSSGAYGSSHTGTAGPHGSNLANKLDPRVDTDSTSRVGGYGGHETSAGYGHSGHTGTTGGAYVHDATTAGHPGTSSYGSNTYGNEGPHSSNLANKLDPRVDSDRDNRNDPSSRIGGYGGQENYGSQGVNPIPSSGQHNTHHTGSSAFGSSNTDYSNTGSGTYGSSNTGPHGSNLANKLDPRVDSDRDDHASRIGGYGGQDNYGSTGVNPASANYGHSGHGTTGASYGHDSTTSGNYGSSYASGPGDVDRTAGPHKSDLLNKLDPRVDSDADGSKTYGGNRPNY